MKNLAISTTSKICSVALLEDDNLIDEINLDDGKTHSENLMPILDELLKKNSLDIKDIEFLSCAVGPGSFTGIRIGVSSIKPIAEILNIKIASVTSLETLAQGVEFAKNTIISLIDARNNQVYAGIFDENFNKKEEYMADDINIVIEKMKKYDDIIFVGNGAILHKELLKQNFETAIFSENNEEYAKNVGKIGYKKYLEGNVLNADTIVPIYLRKSQAERLRGIK